MIPVATIAVGAAIIVSPPPPPAQGPDPAGAIYDEYAGEDLWRSWQGWIRSRASNLAEAAYADITERDGRQLMATGPHTEITTGYWHEVRRFEYVQLCEPDRVTCEWIYRGLGLAAPRSTFETVAEEHYAPEDLAAYFREQGISPDALADDPDRDLGDTAALDRELSDLVAPTVYRESTCPEVAEWTSRLADIAPVHLDGRAADPSQPPLPPFPIHIRQVVEIPFTALHTADVVLRLEDVRSRALQDLWASLTQDLQACQGEG